ncbi:hypothetical protein BJ944DRAFT_237372 [Cunninghamella echinulata]|nr:hypothetical protein BJ944DRAFT_237372 [Cunninghamella echinulata]
MTNALIEKDKLNDLETQLENLLKDPLLSDISNKSSLEEIDQCLAIELNQAYKIQIQRDPLPPINIIIHQSSTVRDLKISFQQEWEKQNNKRKVSWKYIWRTYCLQLCQQQQQQQREFLLLNNDEAIISQLGFQQGSILLFKRLDFGSNKKHRKAWKWYKGH